MQSGIRWLPSFCLVSFKSLLFSNALVVSRKPMALVSCAYRLSVQNGFLSVFLRCYPNRRYRVIGRTTLMRYKTPYCSWIHLFLFSYFTTAKFFILVFIHGFYFFFSIWWQKCVNKAVLWKRERERHNSMKSSRSISVFLLQWWFKVAKKQLSFKV